MQVCSPGHPFYSHHIVDRAKCKSVLPDSRFIPIHMELDVRLPAPSPPSTRYTHIIMVLDAQCLVLLASRRSRDSKWLAEKIEFLYGGGQLSLTARPGSLPLLFISSWCWMHNVSLPPPRRPPPSIRFIHIFLKERANCKSILP